jgi:hypothetical protein
MSDLCVMEPGICPYPAFLTSSADKTSDSVVVGERTAEEERAA